MTNLRTIVVVLGVAAIAATAGYVAGILRVGR